MKTLVEGFKIIGSSKTIFSRDFLRFMAPRIIRFLIWVAIIACGFWILNAVVSMIWYVLR